MSKSVPTRDDVIRLPSAAVKLMDAAFSFERNAPSTGWSTPCALICLESLVGEVLGEAVVLAGARAADRLAEPGNRPGKLALHLYRELVGADVGASKVVDLVDAVDVGEDLHNLVGEFVLGPKAHLVLRSMVIRCARGRSLSHRRTATCSFGGSTPCTAARHCPPIGGERSGAARATYAYPRCDRQELSRCGSVAEGHERRFCDLEDRARVLHEGGDGFLIKVVPVDPTQPRNRSDMPHSRDRRRLSPLVGPIHSAEDKLATSTIGGDDVLSLAHALGKVEEPLRQRLVVRSVRRMSEFLEHLRGRAFSDVADGRVPDGGQAVRDALVDYLAALAGADEPEHGSAFS